MNQQVTVSKERSTTETDIKMRLTLNADATGLSGSTGIGFFDHMLNTFAIHSGISIELKMTGDLNVDCHHTIEDVGIVLGGLLREAVDQLGPLERYGCSHIPMDEALARAVVDISGRPFIVCDYKPINQTVGSFDCCMTSEFFRALAFNMKCTLHLSVLYFENDHHAIEALFKAFAHALKDACKPRNGGVISAKGSL